MASNFMDFEWLLSTLFDASLLSTSSRRQRRLFFVRVMCHFGADGTGFAPLCPAGNYVGRIAARPSGQAAARRVMLTQS